MSVLLVTYALRSKTKDYTPMYEAIKRHTGWWWHYFDDVWIVESNISADAFAKSLYPHMVSTDSLFVVRIARDYQGWLAPEAWKWLNERKFD